MKNKKTLWLSSIMKYENNKENNKFGKFDKLFLFFIFFISILMIIIRPNNMIWSIIPLYGGGAITSVTIDPLTPNIIYAGSDLSGPYKSIDFGNSWKPIRNGLKNEADWSVATLTINPKNHNQIFMGTGVVFDHPTGDYGGLFRSDDAGQSWNLVTRSLKFSGHGDTRQFGDGLIIFDKKNNNIMYAATIWDGIFKSVDKGNNWYYTGLSGLYITGLVMNDESIFASVAKREKINSIVNDSILIDSVSGIYKSIDDGNSWTKIFNGSVQKFVVRGNTIYAAVAGSGIFKSTDGGISWTARNNGISIEGINALVGLTIDPSNPNVLYVISNLWSNKSITSIYKTVNGGGFWENVPYDESNINVNNLWSNDYSRFSSGAHSITIDPNNSNRIYLADSYTVWKSNDGGNTWFTGAKGLETTVTNVIKVHPSIPGLIVIGTNDILGFISTDGGRSNKNLWGWRKGDIIDSDIWDVAYKKSDNETSKAVIYVTTGRNGVGHLWKSSDGGISWKILNSLPYSGEKKAIAVDQTHSNIIYVAARNYDIYKSTNNGKSWVRLTKGFPKNSDIIKIIIDPKNHTNLYALDIRYGIYKSIDGGSSWKLSNKGIPNLEPNDFRCLAIDSNNTNIIYGGGEVYGLYKSIDSGNNWSVILSNFSCGGIFVSPINSAVYVGGMAEWWLNSNTGLMVSKDEGANWSQLGDLINNIPLPYVLNIEEDPFNTGHIYVGTEGGGNYMLRH